MEKFIVIIGLLMAVCGANVSGQGNVKSHPAESEMVFVEGGTFNMGCTSEQGTECWDNENPKHSVTLSSFSIGKYEVTQGQWIALMGSNPSGVKNDNYPVDLVSGNDAQEFIRRLNAATGKNYRLPTEAEWEYAARGGVKSKGYKYSGSNNLSDVAWIDVNSNTNGSKSIHPVGTKQPNELGIYDMSGNVWEWCGDWYDEYPASPQHDPAGPLSGSYILTRGGCYFSEARQCRVAFRSYSHSSSRYKGHGFRLLLPSP